MSEFGDCMTESARLSAKRNPAFTEKPSKKRKWFKMNNLQSVKLFAGKFLLDGQTDDVWAIRAIVSNMYQIRFENRVY